MLTTRLDVSRTRVAAARRPGPPQIGPWRLVTQLGGGSWARVYRARPADCPDERPADYALKVVHRRGPDADAAAALLRREAQAGRAASHPNLVPILSAQLDSPPWYVVMPCLEGVTLAAALAAHGEISVPHALWIARQTAEALLALHRQGWIHADVKASNIVVSPRGHVTLIDLGFARRVGEPHASDHSCILATPAYAAPEVFTKTLPASARSDVYSLGVTLFRTLTGRLPFLETNPTDLAVAHLQQPPPDPRSFAPHLLPRVSWLLKRMLAKEPLRRPDAAELVSLLVELEVESFSERAG